MELPGDGSAIVGQLSSILRTDMDFLLTTLNLKCWSFLWTRPVCCVAPTNPHFTFPKRPSLGPTSVTWHLLSCLVSTLDGLVPDGEAIYATFPTIIAVTLSWPPFHLTVLYINSLPWCGNENKWKDTPYSWVNFLFNNRIKYLLATHALCQLVILYTLLHLPAYMSSSIDGLVSRIVLGAQWNSPF